MSDSGSRRITVMEVRRHGCLIHALRRFEGVVKLYPQNGDERFDDFIATVNGEGNLAQPYHEPASGRSMFQVIVEIWIQKRQKEGSLICVNDFWFKITSVGVIAENGFLTRLLPPDD